MALNITTPFNVPAHPVNYETAAGVITNAEWDDLTIAMTIRMDESYGNYWLYFGNGVDLDNAGWRVRMQPATTSITFTVGQQSALFGGWTDEPGVVVSYPLGTDADLVFTRASNGTVTWTFAGQDVGTIAEVNPIALGTGAVGFSHSAAENTWTVQSLNISGPADVTDDFDSPDGTSLAVHAEEWEFQTGSDLITSIQNQQLGIAAFQKVVAFFSTSAEQKSKITLPPSGTTSGYIGPTINTNLASEGQYFFFKNDDGTYYTTIQIRSDGAYIADIGLPASAYAMADIHTLEIVETANDGTDVTFECYINDTLITTQTALAAVNVAGNDGIYVDRINYNSVGYVGSFDTGVAVATPFSIDAEPTDIQPDDTALEITVSGQATTPTTGNSVVRLDGATGTVLNLTSVRDDTNGVYTLIFDAPAHNAMPDLAYDTAGYAVHVTIDTETNETEEIPFVPPAGYGFVTLTDVTNSDITAAPALAASDQLEYELTTAPDAWDVSVSALGIMALTGGANTVESDTFDVRAWDAADNSWGAFAVQTASLAADSVAPVITLTGGNETVIQGVSWFEPGFSATDNVDGDITGSVVVGGDDVSTAIINVYTLTYDVSDAAGNPATQRTRVITVVAADTVPPAIALTGGNQTVVQGNSWSEPGFSATDDVDGDITGNVVVSGDTVNTGVVGVYTVRYDVSDAAGNPATQRTRVITVAAADTTIPVINLSGLSTVLLAVGSAYVEPGYSATDNVDGDITANVVVTGNVGVTAGDYLLYYNVSDAAGNPATEAVRTVTLYDILPETIQANPASTERYAQNGPNWLLKGDK